MPFTGKTMQEIGSQITYCRRYQLGAILNLASEADDDGEAANGKAGKLASTFSMRSGPERSLPANTGASCPIIPEPPMGLRQQLLASLAAEGKKPEGISAHGEPKIDPAISVQAGPKIRGNGITALRARMHELNGALREASDLDMLEGTLRGFQDDLCECADKLPDFGMPPRRRPSLPAARRWRH